ncbi:chemotaxis response regulator protein-glutamate methylesterase [Trichodesmium erythraeum 21-75]|nr:chemotaxis response regulator protein-glutamate methylesterase [Trichodesmium erythraeum 21-75]
MPKFRILIVDDSVIVRRIINNILSESDWIEVVGVAPSGQIALAKIPQVNPDLIILDVEMPEIDGLETLKRIRQTYKQLPVIMFSAITQGGAIATLDALTLGANDYITKPANMGSKEKAIEYIRKQLIPKIQVFCHRKVSLTKHCLAPSMTSFQRKTSTQLLTLKLEIVAIGVSTGGPQALYQLLHKFPASFRVPIVIVQHMPPVFTTRLAERLSSQCKIPVHEAKDRDVIKSGEAWIAPGNYHIILVREGKQVRIQTIQTPPENSCRPAVDVLFRSVAKLYQGAVLGVILTGMGQDGLHGCTSIREMGGQVLVQDQASSVIWGMPGMVANAGLADQILPLNKLAEEIIRRIG